MLSLSVVLCTRNRAAKLRGALAHYRVWEADTDWELIVVNNASTDDTADVLARVASDFALPLRILEERRPGLSCARNCGLLEARGEIVAFTDDDCYPEPDYLHALRRVFASVPCDYVGGRVFLHDPNDAKIAVQLHGFPYDIEPHAYLQPGQIIGANMAFRRQPLLALRGFDERLGAGTLFRSGEDTDALRRAADAGLRGRYDPAIMVRHHHGRTLQDAAALRRTVQRGISAGMLKFVAHGSTRQRYLRHWYWALRVAGLSSVVRQLGWALLFALRHGLRPARVWHHPAPAIDAANGRKLPAGPGGPD